MNPLDLLIGQTQRNITYLYWGLFSAALAGLLFLPKPIDESVKTVLLMLLATLATIITQQSSFWYARQRSAGVPDPTVTTVTTSQQTVTTPSPAVPPAETPPASQMPTETRL